MRKLSQLDGRETFDPQDARLLTKKMKREALNLITLIKEKRYSTIKGRASVDGRKQRRYISKEDMAYPTVQLKSFILSMLINAEEGRDVATAGIVGAYLLPIMNNLDLLKLQSDSVDLMCRVNAKYKEYITYEKY